MKRHIFSLFLCLLLTASFATHNRSGEITYKRVAPFGTANAPIFTYSITVTRYTDHGPAVADRCADTVYFGDGQMGIAQRINGTGTSTCGCAVGCGQIIASGSGYVVKKNIYSITHTYPGAGIYTVRSSDPFRNFGIHNIPNSGTTPFNLEATIVINNFIGANSSPEFGLSPINQASLGVCFTEDPLITDADGDSLIVELIPCASAPGYFFPELPPNGSYALLTASGPLVWCDPIYVATYHIAYRVDEWRNNGSGLLVKIGSVMREREVIVNWAPVGLEEVDPQGGFVLGPNPAKDRVQLKPASAQAYSYALYDVSGQLIRQENLLQGEKSLELTALPPGLYLIKLQQQDRQICVRLIKE